MLHFSATNLSRDVTFIQTTPYGSQSRSIIRVQLPFMARINAGFCVFRLVVFLLVALNLLLLHKSRPDLPGKP